MRKILGKLIGSIRAGFGGTYAILQNLGSAPSIPPVGYNGLYSDINNNLNTLSPTGPSKQVRTEVLPIVLNTNQTLLYADYKAIVVDSSSSVTISLPAIAGKNGMEFSIMKWGIGDVILQGNGSDQIELTGGVFANTATISRQYTSITFMAIDVGSVQRWKMK